MDSFQAAIDDVHVETDDTLYIVQISERDLGIPLFPGHLFAEHSLDLACCLLVRLSSMIASGHVIFEDSEYFRGSESVPSYISHVGVCIGVCPTAPVLKDEDNLFIPVTDDRQHRWLLRRSTIRKNLVQTQLCDGHASVGFCLILVYFDYEILYMVSRRLLRMHSSPMLTNAQLNSLVV